MSVTKEEALKYHSEGRKGKIEVVPTKPCYTAQRIITCLHSGCSRDRVEKLKK